MDGTNNSGAAAVEELPPNGAVQPGAGAAGGEEGVSDEDIVDLGAAFAVPVQLKEPEQAPVKQEPPVKPDGDKQVDPPPPKPDGDKPEGEEADLELPPEVKERVQKRIDKLTGKRREAEERATAAEQRATQVEAERDQLKAKLEGGGEAKVERVPADVHPILLADNEQAVDEYDRKLVEFEKQLLKAWDGVEAKKEGEPSFTAEQVRQRYAEIREMRETLIPAARKAVATRQQVNQTLVSKHYPDLAKPGTEARKKADALLNSLPALRAHPYAMMFIGAYLEGEKVLHERIAAEKNPPKKEDPPPPPPPPAGGSAPRRGPAEPLKGKPLTEPVRNFIKSGATKDALAEAIDGLETDDEE